MMDQTHIGYTTLERSANEHDAQQLMRLRFRLRQRWVLPSKARRRLAGHPATPALPQFDVFNQQRRYIDVFNRGQTTFDFTATASAPWISVSATHGTVEKNSASLGQRRLEQSPREQHCFVKITGAGDEVKVGSKPFIRKLRHEQSLQGFVEPNGYVSIEAEHYTKTRCRSGSLGENHRLRTDSVVDDNLSRHRGQCSASAELSLPGIQNVFV